MMLDDEHLALPQLSDKSIGAAFLRARAHQGYDGVAQETGLYGVAPVHGYGTTLPGDFKTHHESLYETPCGYVDATMARPRF